jgi:hypothetical protein
MGNRIAAKSLAEMVAHAYERYKGCQVEIQNLNG